MLWNMDFSPCNGFKENEEQKRKLSSVLNRIFYKPATWKCSFLNLLNCLNIERHQMGMCDGIACKYFSINRILSQSPSLKGEQNSQLQWTLQMLSEI